MQDSQSSIRVRFRSTGEEVPADMQTLVEWISSGRVDGNDLVKGDILTGGEWTPLRNMRLFYTTRNQPVPEDLPPVPPLASNSWSEQSSSREANRYPALMLISTLFKVLAVIIAIGSVWMAVEFGRVSSLAPGFGTETIGSVAVISTLVQGAIAALVMWGIAELIRLLIDIESNTRRSAR